MGAHSDPPPPNSLNETPMTDFRCLSETVLDIRPEPLVVREDQGEAIAANWREHRTANPRLFNGSAFLFDPPSVDSRGALAATGALTDYATFLYWRRFRDEMPHHHLFPVGAIVTADARLLVGRMSVHTANPGRIYPPAGSFDHDDIVTHADGSMRLDPLANIAREIGEEIGLSIDVVEPQDGWLMMASTPRAHALVKILRARETAAELRPRIEQHIAEDPAEELARVDFVRFETRFPEGVASGYVNELLAYLDRTSAG